MHHPYVSARARCHPFIREVRRMTFCFTGYGMTRVIDVIFSTFAQADAG